MKNGLTFILFILSLSSYASFKLEYNLDYYHEWNWAVGASETIRSGRCDGQLINQWIVNERNAADFWKSQVTCKNMKPEGKLEESSSSKTLFEFVGQGKVLQSKVSDQNIPVGVKIKYIVNLGVKKLLDYSLLYLPVEKAASCNNGPAESAWATNRNIGHHEIVSLFCNCGALSNLDVITRKPVLSGVEITGVKIRCQRILRY